MSIYTVVLKISSTHPEQEEHGQRLTLQREFYEMQNFIAHYISQNKSIEALNEQNKLKLALSQGLNGFRSGFDDPKTTEKPFLRRSWFFALMEIHHVQIWLWNYMTQATDRMF